MKRITAPTHQSLIRKHSQSLKAKERIRSGVQKLKVISQIIELREGLKMTQSELASRINVSQPFIAKIENDEAANLSLETLIKIVEALNGEMQIKIRPLIKRPPSLKESFIT